MEFIISIFLLLLIGALILEFLQRKRKQEMQQKYENYLGKEMPEISKLELSDARLKLKKVYESEEIYNTTTKANTFFKRLHYAYDLLYDLKQYEKYRIFNTATPTQQIELIDKNLKDIVNNFIDRSYDCAVKNSETFKTEETRKLKMIEYTLDLSYAFDDPHQFWKGAKFASGKEVYHYTGKLYERANYEKVKDIAEAIKNGCVKENVLSDEFSSEEYKKVVEKETKDLLSKVDLTTIDGILNIPSEDKGEEFVYETISLQEILQKKATEFKKSGRMDLAIACLKKANEFIKHEHSIYEHDKYMRLVKYLRQNGQFDEARKEEEKINKLAPKADMNTFRFSREGLRVYKELHGKTPDLFESSETYFVCEECAKYTKRIFSKSGDDKRFPKLPEYFFQNLPEHKYCSIDLSPINLSYQKPVWNYSGDLIEYCDRPFIDDRTKEQKEHFLNEVAQREEKEQDEKDYYWLLENVPDLAPKSFGGYRNMKNKKSANYIKLIEAAMNKGCKINA